MGRPRKYHTPEEKVLANRAKCKRYHERNRELINAQRRLAYKEKLEHEMPEPGVQSVKIQHKPEHCDNELDVWVERVKRIHSRFTTLISHRDSPATYIDSLCAQYLEDKQAANIEHHVSALESFQSSLFRYQDNILNLDGINKAFDDSEIVLKKVKMVLSWTEEVYSVALFNPQDFGKLFQNRHFEYQKV